MCNNYCGMGYGFHRHAKNFLNCVSKLNSVFERMWKLLRPI